MLNFIKESNDHANKVETAFVFNNTIETLKKGELTTVDSLNKLICEF
jgi:hypothetical protein